MEDVSRTELQYEIDMLISYLKQNRNHLAQQLYKEMYRSDCLGQYGHIYCHNNMYDVEIRLHRKKRSKK